MLTVFLIVLPALTPDADLDCGPDPIGMGDVGGCMFVSGARRPLLGVAGVDLKEAESPPVLFLVLLMGSAGSAIDGGPLEGRAGLGSAVDILTFCPLDSLSDCEYGRYWLRYNGGSAGAKAIHIAVRSVEGVIDRDLLLAVGSGEPSECAGFGMTGSRRSRSGSKKRVGERAPFMRC
jgi:hypothetical protein